MNLLRYPAFFISRISILSCNNVKATSQLILKRAFWTGHVARRDVSTEEEQSVRVNDQDTIHYKSDSKIQKYKIPCDDPEIRKTHVFQELKKPQSSNPVYTIEHAAEYKPIENMSTYYKYPTLTQQHTDAEYALRGVENENTIVFHFPELTDFLIIGSGLIGSATAYYLKKTASRAADVVVLDKAPYSTNNCTALCNGLISTQSKCQDISRIASLSKELIRNLKNDVLVTKEDFARIKYRPCTHLILWPETEIEDVLKATAVQIEDGCYTEAKMPHELEISFPWLKACGTDIALGTHGNQDEALVDPIGLRNLYRTLAQAHGAFFICAEVVDFNTMFSIRHDEISPYGAGAIVARIPSSGELRNLGFAKTLLSLGHNTPYLEARSEMEAFMRDQIEDLHFLQPKLRIYFSFHSLKAPIINFPVITDTDGSMLIRDDYSGDFKYYLTYEQSESFFDTDHQRFMELDSDDPYPNLIHRSEIFKNYFNNVIKTKLVRRIPIMEDAKFNIAYSGFESQNSHDGSPIISPHPFHSKVLLSGGYGSRMMNYGPSAAASFTELMLGDEEESFDMTHFYWNRVIKGRTVQEFKNLLQ